VRITDLKLSRALPFAIATLIATNLAAIGYADLMINDLAKGSQELVENTKKSDKLITELAVLTKGIELDIVSTQEALTDVSATRALDGLDDGFALAEESAQELKAKAKTGDRNRQQPGRTGIGRGSSFIGRKLRGFPRRRDRNGQGICCRRSD
jgi:methyl-accepting chemotaxis protein